MSEEKKDYSFDYFIEKFSQIKEEDWTNSDGKGWVYSFCASHEERMALYNNFDEGKTREGLSEGRDLISINDGRSVYANNFGNTYKSRVVNYLIFRKKRDSLINGSSDAISVMKSIEDDRKNY